MGDSKLGGVADTLEGRAAADGPGQTGKMSCQDLVKFRQSPVQGLTQPCVAGQAGSCLGSSLVDYAGVTVDESAVWPCKQMCPAAYWAEYSR